MRDDQVRDFYVGDDEKQTLSPFHQISPKFGQTLRVSLLTHFVKPKASAYHWYREQFIRCNSPKDAPESAICCQKVGKPSWTCVVMALQYLDADKDGKLSGSVTPKFRVGYISMSRTAYTQVSTITAEVPLCDLYYSKGADGYQFVGASSLPRWQSMASTVELAAAPFLDGQKLASKLGKKFTDAEWKSLIAHGSPHWEED
jgi:hypothetical protein